MESITNLEEREASVRSELLEWRLKLDLAQCKPSLVRLAQAREQLRVAMREHGGVRMYVTMLVLKLGLLVLLCYCIYRSIRRLRSGAISRHHAQVVPFRNSTLYFLVAGVLMVVATLMLFLPLMVYPLLTARLPPSLAKWVLYSDDSSARYASFLKTGHSLAGFKVTMFLAPLWAVALLLMGSAVKFAWRGSKQAVLDEAAFQALLREELESNEDEESEDCHGRIEAGKLRAASSEHSSLRGDNGE